MLHSLVLLAKQLNVLIEPYNYIKLIIKMAQNTIQAQIHYFILFIYLHFVFIINIQAMQLTIKQLKS